MSTAHILGQKPAFSFDWTRDSPPPNITPYQQFVRSIDWSSTSIGPMREWSRELRQAVLMMMAEVNPVILYWGDDYTMIYNEAYVPLVGSQHPNNMGKNAPVIFPEFWDYFDRVISIQKQTGETQVGEASMLPLTRKGYVEETYFDWMLIPVICDDGQIHGAYGRPTESTTEVVRSRRAACIQNLSQQLNGVNSFDDLWKASIRGLSVNDKDIPMLLLYTAAQDITLFGSLARNSASYKLAESLGVRQPANNLQQIDLHNTTDTLSGMLSRAWKSGELLEINPTTDGYSNLQACFKDNEWRGFGVPSEEFVILPCKTGADIFAILVIGLNPHIKADQSFRDFLKAIADNMSSQISRLQLSLEVQKRAADARVASLEFQRSESKFSRFAQRSPVGLALTDPNGNVEFANEAWLNFTGLDGATFDISNWITTVHEDDVPMIREIWDRLALTKTGETFQVRSKVPFQSAHMQSSYRTAMCAIYPDLDERGEVSTVMGLVLDISEQKWVEEQLMIRQKELEKSESRYRTFAERSPHGVVCTDEHGYVTFANDAWHDMYGFERGKVVEPEPWLTHLVEEDRESARDYFRMVKANDGPHTIEIRQRTRINESGKVERQTQELWLLATGWAEYRPDGSIKAVVFWVTDITAQKLAARVLEEKMEEAIRLKTQQERFIDMISHEIRNPLSAILHCGEDIVDCMRQCLTSMDSLPYPDTLPVKEASLQTQTRNHVNSALDSANTIMYCVQHQKQIVDDVLTLSKLDSDLLVVTPIPVQPKELLDSVLKIFDSEARSSNIGIQIDKSTSLEELGIDWIMLDPNRFLQIVINLVTNAIKFTRGSAVRNINIGVSACIERPPTHHNGVKYVPQNASSRSTALSHNIIKTEEDSSDQLFLCFSITDTGKGLTEEESSTLFNRFAQGSPKTHTQYGGSGLGLFISRQITEMLGGLIGVGQAPGGGCRFAFYVKTCRASPPRRPSDQTSAVLQSGLTLPSGTSINADRAEKIQRPRRRPNVKDTTESQIKRRVLVVEDNLVNQRVLCKQLRNRGFIVEAANHGKEALDALHKTPTDPSEENVYFDVILCDIEMPVMDGIECVTEIRRQETHGILSGHIPIIGVTANVRSTQVSMAIEVGMDGVTTKPYKIDELIAHMDRVCASGHTTRSQSPST